MNPANATLNSTIVSLSLASTGTQTESNNFTKAPYILRETKEICWNCGEKGEIVSLLILVWEKWTLGRLEIDWCIATI
jgi:hypothetical protein